jgi:phage terminase Nu1 subunit (DNA packaging protein)
MADATVNKDEMARLLGVSLPTFSDLMKDNPDLPIAQEGSRGIPYAFDPKAVLSWKAAKQDAAQRQIAERTEFLAQFEFPAAPDEPSAQAQTPAQRLQTAKALKAERELQMEAGHLVHTAGVRQALQVALAVLGKRLDNLPSIVGREFNLPEPVQRAMRRQLDDARALMVRDIKAAIAGAAQPDAGDDHLFAAAE